MVTSAHPSCPFMRPALFPPAHTDTCSQILQCIRHAQCRHKCVSSVLRLQNKPVPQKYVHSSTLPPSVSCTLTYTYVKSNSSLNPSCTQSDLSTTFVDILQTYTHLALYLRSHVLSKHAPEYIQMRVPLQTTPSKATAHDIVPRVQMHTCRDLPYTSSMSLHALGLPTSVPDPVMHATYALLGTASPPCARCAVLMTRTWHSHMHGPRLEPMPTHSPRWPGQSCNSGNLGQRPRGSGDRGRSLWSGPAMPFFK